MSLDSSAAKMEEVEGTAGGQGSLVGDGHGCTVQSSDSQELLEEGFEAWSQLCDFCAL